MKMLRPLLLALFVLMELSACTYTQAVSQSNIPAMRSKPIETSVKKYVFLGFNFDNDFIYKLTKDLRAKCPNGDIKGVTTHDSITMYVLIFFWSRDVSARGYCVPHRSVADQDVDLDLDGIAFFKP